jgi:HAD superfamily phosphatase (TIGR01668 family)
MIVYPDFKVRRFTEIDQSFLQTHDLQGLLVDLDNTLVGWHAMDIPKDIAQHVASLRSNGIQLCITSNTYNFNRLRTLADELDIHYYDGNAGKPGTRGLLAGLGQMGVAPQRAAMVGDQLFTDIKAGSRAGVKTILVNPLTTRDFIGTKLVSRTLENLVLRGAQSRP